MGRAVRLRERDARNRDSLSPSFLPTAGPSEDTGVSGANEGPKRRWRKPSWLVLVAVLLGVAPAEAQTTGEVTLVSNINQGAGQGGQPATHNLANHDLAQGFRSRGGAALTSVELVFAVVPSSDLQVWVHQDDPDGPVVARLTVDASSLTTGENTFRTSSGGIELADRSYFVVLSAASGRVRGTLSNDEDCGLPDWRVWDAGWERGADGVWNVLDQTRSIRIKVNGTPSPPSIGDWEGPERLLVGNTDDTSTVFAAFRADRDDANDVQNRCGYHDFAQRFTTGAQSTRATHLTHYPHRTHGLQYTVSLRANKQEFVNGECRNLPGQRLSFGSYGPLDQPVRLLPNTRYRIVFDHLQGGQISDSPINSNRGVFRAATWNGENRESMSGWAVEDKHRRRWQCAVDLGSGSSCSKSKSDAGAINASGSDWEWMQVPSNCQGSPGDGNNFPSGIGGGMWEDYEVEFELRGRCIGCPEDAPRPTVSSAAIDGTAVTLTFDGALDEDSVPDTGNFHLEWQGSIRSVSDVGISGRTVTFTMAQAPNPGDAVTVTYVKPASNPLRDAANGNDVETFRDLAVTNNTGRGPGDPGGGGSPLGGGGGGSPSGGGGDPEPANGAPETAEEIDDRTLRAGAALEIDRAVAFDDPDGDALEYAAESSDPAVASAAVDGTTLTVRGVGPGAAEITMTAKDPDGATASQTFAVTVTGPETVWYLPPASDPARQGFVRVVNHSDAAGEATVTATDDAGVEYAPLVLALGPRQARHFNSEDLELGNADKGLTGATGPGTGGWRLELTSELDLEVLSYVRTPGGALSSVHDVVPEDESGAHRVVFFNPASNRVRVSGLRLINLGAEAAAVRISGLDDAGEVGERAVEVHSRGPGLAELERASAGVRGGRGAHRCARRRRGQVAPASHRRPTDSGDEPARQRGRGHLTNLPPADRGRGYERAPAVSLDTPKYTW